MDLDVAIIGGGLASGTLARQLARRLPSLSIGVFERGGAPDFKVGESTVEIASAYFGRRLGLTRYLYEEHLPKNGLRFFFDDPERSLDLPSMSEIGADGLPFHPSFQLDRARLDADLRRMNADLGVAVRTGAKVRSVEVGTDGRRHRLTVEIDDALQEVTARWVVDASGRTRLLAKTLGLPRLDVGHHTCAVWGRFEGVADLDDIGPASWRQRVRGSSRFLSTNHFCYPGYWIWFIPIKHGIVSVGVVAEQHLWRDAWRSPAGFRAFLDEHRAVADLLRDATLVDTKSYAKVAYGGEKFFSPDRWALVGEAGAFTDPFYSPGSDFIAMENDFVTDLVVRDVEGSSRTEFEAHVEAYDAFVRFRVDANLALYRGLYPVLGSYEILKLKWEFDIHFYYNLWLDAYLHDRHLDLRWVREQLGSREPSLTMLDNFARLFRTLEHELRSRGSYHRSNAGLYDAGLGTVDFVEAIGRDRPRKQVLRAAQDCCNRVRSQAHRYLGANTPREPLPLYAFMSERSILD